MSRRRRVADHCSEGPLAPLVSQRVPDEVTDVVAAGRSARSARSVSGRVGFDSSVWERVISARGDNSVVVGDVRNRSGAVSRNRGGSMHASAFTASSSTADRDSLRAEADVFVRSTGVVGALVKGPGGMKTRSARPPLLPQLSAWTRRGGRIALRVYGHSTSKCISCAQALNGCACRRRQLGGGHGTRRIACSD